MGTGRKAGFRNRAAVFLGLLLIVGLALGPGASAHHRRPHVVPLPDGFQPEGIATRGDDTFFVGSIPTGAIYRGGLRSGKGAIFVPPQEGRSAIGLSLRDDVLFVAGGQTGQGYAYDARTGADLGEFQLTTDSTFVNDVVATKRAAYFTDSVNQRLYKVPIEHKRRFGEPESIPISGDLFYQEGFNANGIDATPDGKTLVIVQSNTGRLFKADPRSGNTRMIDLGGETVPNGDGILLDGRRLWVVQNQDNLLTLVKLRRHLSSGEIVERFSDETFDVPTTVAKAGDWLAIVNARFGTASPETAEYWVTQIRRPH